MTLQGYSRGFKYLISVAIEMDGHASSESYFIEGSRAYKLKELFELVFSKEIANKEVEATHITPDAIYGVFYQDYEFAFTSTQLTNYSKNKLYLVESRTG